MNANCSHHDAQGHIRTSQPKARLYRQGAGWTLQVALPGISQEQLKVEVEGGCLRVTAEGARRRFERSFKLPRAQELDEVEASLEAGLLTLKLSAVSPTRREIEVQSA